MDYKKIDMESFPRKEHFLHFTAMADPYAGITVDVDITNSLSACKRRGNPFHLSFLYCIGRAANLVPQFRQRILDGGIVEFDHCDVSPTELRPDGTYGYFQVNPMQPYASYIVEARAKQEQARSSDTIAEDDTLPLLFTSALPWFTTLYIHHPTPRPADSNPRISWSKYRDVGGKICTPVGVFVNHALADGFHIAQFYARLEEQLCCFANDDTYESLGG